MRVFNVTFYVRKGLGPAEFEKTIPVGLDDLPEDINEGDVLIMVRHEAERQLMLSEDYRWYGKNWRLKEIEED